MKRELVEEEPQFSFEPPAAGGFIWQETLTIRGREVSQQGRADVSPSDHAETLLDNAVLRSERDVERYPKSARSFVNLGFAKLARGDLADALEAFNEALGLDDRNTTAALYAARALVLAGRLDDAEAQYQRLLEDGKVRNRVLMHMADLARRRGNLDAAIALWEQALDTEPESAAAHANLGILLAARQRYDRAIRHLRTATHIETGRPSLHLGLGIAYALSGQPKRAERSLRTAIQIAPRLTDAYHALAAILLQERAYAEAEEVLSRLREYEPRDFEALQLLAEVAYRTRRYKHAAEWVTAALEVSPDDVQVRARLLNNRGVAESFAGRSRAAQDSLRRAISLRPPTPKAYYNLARLLIDTGEAAAAIGVLGEASERFPREPTGRMLRVVALESTERYDAAIDELMRWVLESDAPPDAWAGLGQLLTDAKDNPLAAIPALRDGASKYPDDRQLGNNLAYALLMADQDAEARRVLEGIPRVAEDPEVADAVLAATWGLLQIHEGDRDAGEAGYRAAIEIARQIGSESLALAAEQKMRLELARSSLRDLDFEYAQEAIRAGLAVPAFGLYQRHLRRLEAELLRGQPRA